MPDDMSWPDGSGTSWTVRYSHQFQSQIGQRFFRRQNWRELITQRLEILLSDPQRAARAERLSQQFAGLRSARIDRRYRIIYKLCRECVSFDDRTRWPLDCCVLGEVDESAVNILFISDHYCDLPGRFSVDLDSGVGDP